MAGDITTELKQGRQATMYSLMSMILIFFPTNFPVYVDARSDCNKLTFHLGPAAVGLAKVDTRSWSLKV